MTRMVVASLVAVAVVGCAADHATAPAGVVGDWWLCELSDCATLRDRGARFAGDDTWVMIEVLGTANPDPTQGYCSSPNLANNGTYTFDPATGTLATTDQLGAVTSGTFTYTATTATWSVQTQHAYYRKIDPTHLTGPCY